MPCRSSEYMRATNEVFTCRPVTRKLLARNAVCSSVTPRTMRRWRKKVCLAREAAGYPCWIVPRNVVPGTLYADGIVRALDESRVLVLILSKEAIASAHVEGNSNGQRRNAADRLSLCRVRLACHCTPANRRLLSSVAINSMNKAVQVLRGQCVVTGLSIPLLQSSERRNHVKELGQFVATGFAVSGATGHD